MTAGSLELSDYQPQKFNDIHTARAKRPRHRLGTSELRFWAVLAYQLSIVDHLFAAVPTWTPHLNSGAIGARRCEMPLSVPATPEISAKELLAELIVLLDLAGCGKSLFDLWLLKS
jgi:hypothetical protein